VPDLRPPGGGQSVHRQGSLRLAAFHRAEPVGLGHSPGHHVPLRTRGQEDSGRAGREPDDHGPLLRHRLVLPPRRRCRGQGSDLLHGPDGDGSRGLGAGRFLPPGCDVPDSALPHQLHPSTAGQQLGECPEQWWRSLLRGPVWEAFLEARGRNKHERFCACGSANLATWQSVQGRPGCAIQGAQRLQWEWIGPHEPSWASSWTASSWTLTSASDACTDARSDSFFAHSDATIRRLAVLLVVGQRRGQVWVLWLRFLGAF